MTPRPFALVGALVTLVALVVGAVPALAHVGDGAVPRMPATAIAAQEPVDVPVRAPGTAPAGQPLTVEAGPFPQTTGEASVTITGTYATWTQTVLVVRGVAQVPVPAEATVRSGLLTVRIAGAGGVARAAIDVQPGAVVAPVTPLVGARAIQADGEHWAMVVTIPQDLFGNPAAEGTSVSLRALHPDGVEDTFALTVEGAITWTRVFSRTLAGRTRVAAAVGDVRGPEADLLELPGPPVALPLERDAQPLVADGRSLVTVRTAVLVDAHDNVVADGTDVRFRVRGPDGARTLSAPTVNGVAEVVLEAPTVAGDVSVTAVASGVAGEPLVLDYEAPATGRFDVTARHEGDQVIVEVGPVLGDLGQYLPDGTEVVIDVRTDGRTRTAVTTLDGGLATASVWIDRDRPLNVIVTVAGTARTVEVAP